MYLPYAGYKIAYTHTRSHVPFAVEKDLLTPTLKRLQAKQYYANQIVAMYATLN
jgi:hypothetical protein